MFLNENKYICVKHKTTYYIKDRFKFTAIYQHPQTNTRPNYYF